MKKQIKLSTAVIAVITAIIVTTAAFMVFPFSLLGYRNVTSAEDEAFTSQFRKLEVIKGIIEDNYIGKIDENKISEDAIRGMVDSLGDPYTTYMDKSEYDKYNTQIVGSYAGIGTYIEANTNGDGRIIVVAPIEGSPAEKAGIKPGDEILKVDGKDVYANEIDKAVAMMLGKPGTKVQMTFMRAGKGKFDVTITREKIVLNRVTGKMLSKNIGYIKLKMFDEDTASSFISQYDALNKDGMKGLIIDLRDNPGGLLEESVKIADKLLGKGTIVYTIDKKNSKEVWSSDANKFGKPLVLLVNGNTASAAEILSGAVRDFKAGTLIGTKTFGKGIVQLPFKLTDGSVVKVTIAKYYTPSGECIQKKGIKPDILLDLPAKDKNRKLSPSEDVQIQKAIQVLNSKI